MIKENIHAKYKCAWPPLPYITWGLVQDLKTKKRDSDIYIKIKDIKKEGRKKKLLI